MTPASAQSGKVKIDRRRNEPRRPGPTWPTASRRRSAAPKAVVRRSAEVGVEQLAEEVRGAEDAAAAAHPAGE